MSNGHLQHIADTIAIEALASDLPIQKEAGLFDDLGFSGVASSIASKVKGLLVEDDSPTGWLKAIGDMLVSGALFKVHPLLGIVYAAARVLGVDIIGIGKKILEGVYDAVKGGAKVAMSDIDRFAKVGSYNRGLIVEAQLFGRKTKRRGKSTIESLFGELYRAGRTRKLKNLIVAIVIWVLKRALIGAGLIGGAALITGIIKGDSKKDKKDEEVSKETEPEPESEPEEHRPSLEELAKDTGMPEDTYENDHRAYMWMAPVVGSLKQTLASWAEAIYPELSGYESMIYSSPSFTKVLNEFERNYDWGDTTVIVPQRFKSRKQVVDTFAKDVLRKIKEMT